MCVHYLVLSFWYGQLSTIRGWYDHSIIYKFSIKLSQCPRYINYVCSINIFYSFKLSIFHLQILIQNSSGTCYHIFGSFRVLVINNFQNIIVCERSKPASLCHCLLVVCHLGSLACTMKKSEDLHNII